MKPKATFPDQLLTVPVAIAFFSLPDHRPEPVAVSFPLPAT